MISVLVVYFYREQDYFLTRESLFHKTKPVMKDVEDLLIAFLLIVALMVSILCLVSAIFNQWAYRHVLAIKNARVRRIVLLSVGLAILIALVTFLISVKPNSVS